MAGRVFDRMLMIIPLIGGALFFLAVIAINGGYVYKTTCPRPTGGNDSSWSYNIDDIVPYTRTVSPPCSTHSASRLALSWVGIWSLGHGATPVKITTADKQEAVALGAATKATADEYARENAASAAITKEMQAKGVTRALEDKLVAFVKGSITKWGAIKARVDQPTSASDKQLLEARQLLSTFVGYLATSDRLLLSGTSGKDVNAQYGGKLVTTARRLQYDLAFLKARYPQVKDWTNLPSK
ncbi:MAG: hypothetical protein E6J20_17635 [Chloroflexi bacterium]|nr:MAG: hypothetical protein E6J20_17635 [Chloroflexota bacterium]